MEICTIGFGQKDAETFFGLLKGAGVKQLLDVRLNNMSQLAGFTKKSDLPYFLEEICGATYQHELLLAPTKEMLDSYRNEGRHWEEYEERFLALMAQRQIETALAPSLFAPLPFYSAVNRPRRNVTDAWWRSICKVSGWGSPSSICKDSG